MRQVVGKQRDRRLMVHVTESAQNTFLNFFRTKTELFQFSGLLPLWRRYANQKKDLTKGLETVNYKER